jgi:hypothetical protein
VRNERTAARGVHFEQARAMFVQNERQGAKACGIVGKGKARAFARERAGFWKRDGVPVSYESVAGAAPAGFAT